MSAPRKRTSFGPAAAPPTSAMNSRRLVRPPRPGRSSCLADRRPKSEDMPEINLLTAVDVAIRDQVERDLVEIESIWGTPQARGS
jgi:hypothetical protein